MKANIKGHNTLRVLWTAKRTNRSILQEIKPEKALTSVVIEQQMRYFGHVCRAEGSLEKDIMLGQVEGKQRRGRPRMRWIDQIKSASQKSLHDLESLANNRTEFRRLVKEVTRSRRRPDGTG